METRQTGTAPVVEESPPRAGRRVLGHMLAAVAILAAFTLGGCGSTDPGGAPSSAPVVDGGVQRVFVDVSNGYFDPTTIELAAGVPAEITFSQGSGCLAQVQFPQLGIFEDLTNGGAIVRIPALDAGEYPFSCGMQMVFGSLVVR
jgi:hypothetical protein